jgi:fatty-acyl-CoA synthase
VGVRAGVPAPDEAALIAWCHAHMAAYKSPRLIEFVPSLPKSGSGKLMWRELQEQARQAATPIPDPQ